MSIKNSLRRFLHSNSLGVLVINLKRIINQQHLLRKYTDQEFVIKEYKKRTGRDLNLDNPKRFTEKLQWEKLYYRNPVMTTCVDKIAARKYLKEKGYEDLLMPVFGAYRSVKEIPFEQLPKKCILKASHGSSMHLIKTEDIQRIPFLWKLIMKSWLKMNIYAEGREWPYKDVRPGIIVENFVEAKTENKLKDYKFFCFNGKPEFIQVDVDLLKDHRINFYDTSWNLLPIHCQYPNSEKQVKKPFNFEKMKQIAADLSNTFPHVRVDFYEYDDVLKIGELTFFDGSGFYSFTPDEYDYRFGEKMALERYE